MAGSERQTNKLTRGVLGRGANRSVRVQCISELIEHGSNDFPRDRSLISVRVRRGKQILARGVLRHTVLAQSAQSVLILAPIRAEQ